MSNNFSTYRKFIYKDDALELIKTLEQNEIIFELEDNSSRLDSSFGGDINAKQFELKIQKEDFDNVEKLEEELVKNDVENIERDYYLFEYSDEELIEIVLKKEEWNKFDYLLAQKILKERGKEIRPELLNVISKQRIKELSQEEEVPKMWIYFGYLFAIIGGFIGVIIGYTIMSYKRNLSNGNSAYLYRKEDRKQGQNILICSIIGIIFWIIVRFINKNY
ncbi:ABC-type lipoprotein release transport system permease subunit [Chryseobacterium ginsenosidimutans]|uniref:hypothetical protein n=1 Tax=Chryseobacterium ginsenosidimutans TaxID=687846 RepID=UPI002167D3AB|nr:hypothetical protein [Chryseobacterium ginsenosidimutans]MCS3867555.1 ABC-type lipoprotein release transport system permease subunit [Chryseobacterium ginsenosidimutans]